MLAVVGSLRCPVWSPCDHVLPAVGYRQWVLSFEGPLAQRLGYDRTLLAEVAGALARAVMRDIRWAVKERHDLGSVEPLHAGVFMVVQRFRGDLGLDVHLHALATDGAFEEDGGDDDSPAAAESSARPRRVGWARLLARVFAIDVTVCRKCGGRMRVLDVVTDPDDITRLLHGARAPPHLRCSPSPGLRRAAPVRTPSPPIAAAGHSSYRLGREFSRLKPLRRKRIAAIVETTRGTCGGTRTDLRRAIDAIRWVLHNGAKWREMPKDLGRGAALLDLEHGQARSLRESGASVRADGYVEHRSARWSA